MLYRARFNSTKISSKIIGLAIYNNRFSPIEKHELKNLECCVSLLTDFQKCNDWQDWNVGISILIYIRKTWNYYQVWRKVFKLFNLKVVYHTLLLICQMLLKARGGMWLKQLIPWSKNQVIDIPLRQICVINWRFSGMDPARNACFTWIFRV